MPTPTGVLVAQFEAAPTDRPEGPEVAKGPRLREVTDGIEARAEPDEMAEEVRAPGLVPQPRLFRPKVPGSSGGPSAVFFEGSGDVLQGFGRGCVVSFSPSWLLVGGRTSAVMEASAG